jgi:hypothetical protein
MMHEWCGPIPNDVPTLSRATSTTPATVKTYLGTLLSRGLVFEISNEELWAPAAQRQKDEQEKQSELQREKSSQRWGKDKENQWSDDAAAYRYENRDIDRDSHPQKEDGKSTKSSPSNRSKTNVEDKAARGSAASHQPGDEIDLPDIGQGWVEKIVSLSPPIVAAIVRDDEGYASGYRVQFLNSGKLRVSEMDLEELYSLPDMPEEDSHDAA